MAKMHNPPHPASILREDVLPALGLTVTEAARQLGVSRVALSRPLQKIKRAVPEAAWRGTSAHPHLPNRREATPTFLNIDLAEIQAPPDVQAFTMFKTGKISSVTGNRPQSLMTCGNSIWWRGVKAFRRLAVGPPMI